MLAGSVCRLPHLVHVDASAQPVDPSNKQRLLRQHDLRRRFVATTDRKHDGPIFPNLAKDIVPTGPNQLWVSDITYVALPTRFIYVAVI
ncbi:hypothetical protein [Rhizobium sp. Root1220]|uniref:hypothetical protein n=1 Tax=Rhizobium sp. Root1220 TaxID=1736432 RepID=UPI00138F2CED|nr:hypothetical protein [Rhizobium sp. Root1220]